MKVIICGAGQVGYGIAERLAIEGNDVSIIDNSQDLVQRVNDNLDARGILGHGAHPNILKEAGARDTDMLIAVTRSDEVNMVACQLGHSLFNIPTKIARIRDQNYLGKEWRDVFSRDHLPIDVIISPEIEVGEMVLRRLNQPGAFETIDFADGRVQVIGVNCDENCPVVDTPLKQLTELFPDLPAVIVAVVREGRLFVPHGDDQLLSGDEVYLVAQHEQVPRTLKIFGHEEKKARRVIIVGGGNIGLYVARELEARQLKIRAKVIEGDRDRAVRIAEKLNRTIVLHGDALDEEILQEAEASQADAVLTLTNNDQVNILTCVLARELGCERSMCLINSAGYANIVRSLGIHAQINPRAITVSRVLQHVRRGRIRGVHSVQNGAAEIIEAEALSTAPVVGKTIRELGLPDGLRFGAILRDKDVIMPDGNTEIRAKDRVVIFALGEYVRNVEQLFRVSVEYF